jgi:hypothetical protein
MWIRIPQKRAACTCIIDKQIKYRSTLDELHVGTLIMYAAHDDMALLVHNKYLFLE